MVHDDILRFGVLGIVKGRSLIADEETRTNWNHLSGRATEGPLLGHRLDARPIKMTTVDAALGADLQAPLLLSDYFSPRKRFFLLNT
jgi:hypothetical protein